MQLRAAQPEDALGVAHVHVRSWQAAYRGLLPAEYLDRLRPQDWASRYDFGSPDDCKPQTILATGKGSIHGFVTTMPSRDSDLPEHGELCALYVDPTQWGRGIGLALITAARARLLEQGFRNALLWILAGNVRGDRFYQLDHWAPDGQRRTDTVWGITVDELRYQRSLGTPPTPPGR
ncbi:GNAT family N-acetyltransferase [Acidipila rosea]|uniref:L-amino acid N-acyltransferase YncA n=1 Tax=Acidipila rosea TaxID=768535 RepID=A0A4R1KZ76_9BACT|nr:GNAT family N-acetyltransferase [Acidipila rosea]TCK70875.1 L-amino acid N-acyltransferase YncA [Acidipila rosea]